jgi:hypothetical protein
MTSVKMFPILIGYGGTEGPCPSSIPWDAIAPYEGHAQANHQQSLERLAERGGLSPEEAFYVMTGRRWRGETFTKEFRREACAFLDKLVRDRGELQTAHDRYKAAFEKYGYHKPSCKIRDGGEGPDGIACSCGFDDVRNSSECGKTNG